MKIFFFLQIILNILITLKINKFSKFINILDRPDGNLKRHHFNIPLLGGVIIFLNLSLIFFCSFFFDYDLFNIKISLNEKISAISLLLLFFCLGLFDDKYGIKPGKKILLSITFSILILNLNSNLLIDDIKLSFIDNQLSLQGFNYLFTIFCFVILINALNFYDGINGQSCIFFIICFTYLAYRSPIFIFYITIIIALAFILFLNFSNKLFMGDNGIYIIGSILILGLIYEYNVFRSIEYADEIFLLLLLPGYDLLRLSITRIFKGKNAFYGDRNHIQHMLINKFSILISNLILFVLATLPIFLHLFMKLNFFVILFIITIIYIIIIMKLKNND